jgi:signal transduction histidine kinase
MIHYENEDEIYINGDYDRLKQGFINLIKNSIESKDKDFLIIDIKIKKLKKHYKIYVTDNGRGMNSEVLNRIGEPFYSTKQTGTGIGMAYVKKIIELHKGKISYKSKEKEGTTVVVTLPLLD